MIVARHVTYVIFRNYFIFKKIFAISLFPNLFEPLLFLLAIAGALKNTVSISGIDYMAFTAIGLSITTALSGATNETTYNAFIQMKLDKSYYSIMITPVNVKNIILGHILWASIRSIIFGSAFLIISSILIGKIELLSVLPIHIIVIFLTGLMFGSLGMIFTSFSKKMDYVNFYNTVFIRVIILFSNVFFPLDYFGGVSKILAISPLVHLINTSRSYYVNNAINLNSFIHIIISTIFLIPLSIHIAERSIKK